MIFLLLFFCVIYAKPLAIIGQDATNPNGRIRYARLFVFDPVFSTVPSLQLTMTAKGPEDLADTVTSLKCKQSTKHPPPQCIVGGNSFGTQGNWFNVFAYNINQLGAGLFAATPYKCNAPSVEMCHVGLAYTDKYGFEATFGTRMAFGKRFSFFDGVVFSLSATSSNVTRNTITLKEKRGVSVGVDVTTSYGFVEVPPLNALCSFSNDNNNNVNFFQCQDFDTSLPVLNYNLTQMLPQQPVFDYPVCRFVPPGTPNGHKRVVCFNNNASAPGGYLIDLTSPGVQPLPTLSPTTTGGRVFVGDAATIVRFNTTSLLLVPLSDPKSSPLWRDDLLAVYDVSPAPQYPPFVTKIPGVARSQAISAFWPLG